MKPADRKPPKKKVVAISPERTAKSTDWKRALRTVKANSGDEKRAALQRLGVTPRELEKAFPISSLLKYADGGMPQVISAMRMSDDPLIVQFLAKFDAVSVHDRRRLPLEAIALSAGVNVNHLLGCAVLALQAQAISIVKIMAMTSHPKIVASRIRFGQLPQGDRDRQALDQAMGFLPSPKGPTFIGKAIFGSGRSAMDAQRLGNGPDDDDEGEVPMADDEVDLDRIFPPANRMQERLAAIRQKMLLADNKTRPN
jgi:hypothetical protein